MSAGWQESGGLHWRPIEPFGAEIAGDLSAPLGADTAERLRSLFRNHALLVARRQSLNRAAHDALMAHVGPIIAHREGDSGVMYSDGEDGPATSKLSFHADTAYTETPFEALSLHALDVVDGASSTRFVHVERALETLPSRLRIALETHDADMMSSGVEKLAVRLCDIREHPSPGYRNRLPAIRRNARSGRYYVGVSEMQTAALFGMSWEESRAILTDVFAHLYAPEHIHEHRWHRGDLVMWDNLALQHGRGSLKDVGRRVLQRVIVGPKSFAIRPSSAAAV